MASPFRTFRKNQKIWMVVLTILAMFAFVILGSSSRLGMGTSKREDPDIFTWDFGTVHRSELEYRKTVLNALNQFLATAGTSAGLAPQQINQLMFAVSDKAVVNTILLDKKAEQMGIFISDAMINNYINGITDDKLSQPQLSNIVRTITQRFDGIGQTQLFDALRSELAASYAQRSFMPLLNRATSMGGMTLPVFRGDTPGERWDYFCRLNLKATAEIMPVSVEKFVADIADPSSEQLKSFYEQYKTAEPEPSSPSPGFRQPFKAKFQYIKADYEPLLAAESPKITQDQIKDYYDTHKQEFIKTKLPELPESGEPGGKAGSEGAATPPVGAAKTDGAKSDVEKSKPADVKSTDAKAPEQKAAGAKSSDAKSSNSKSPDAKPSNSKSSSTKTPDTKTQDDQKQPSDGKQSSISLPPGPNGKPTMTTALDDNMLLAQAGAPSSKSSDAKSATGKSTDVKSTDAKAIDAKSTDAKSTDSKSAEAPAADGKTSAPDRTVEYDSLDKVADTIRNRLAQQRVDEQINTAFSGIEAQVMQYNRNLEKYRAAVSRGNKEAKKPEPPDLTALAKPSGLEAKETEMISAEQARDHTDIGKSRRALAPGEYNTPSFLDSAFHTDSKGEATLAVYQPQRSDDNENNQFLWWKIADVAAHTPPLDEIKAEVVMAWKIIQARKPALAKANEDAEQARKLKQTLKETFGSVEGNGLTTIGPFSWLTQPVGQMFGAPQLTKLSDVELAGNEFMSSVFTLKPGETGVTVNEPQTVYYVVQIESEEPTLDALHEQFMTKMSNDISKIPYAYIGVEENQHLLPAWMKQVQNEFGYQLAPGETLSNARSNASSED